eukprot:6467591-Amphidinium_carterae.1
MRANVGMEQIGPKGMHVGMEQIRPKGMHSPSSYGHADKNRYFCHAAQAHARNTAMDVQHDSSSTSRLKQLREPTRLRYSLASCVSNAGVSTLSCGVPGVGVRFRGAFSPLSSCV